MADLLKQDVKKRHVKSSNIEKAFLIGERVYLRPLEREDLKGPYRLWINDPEITHYLVAGAFPLTDDELAGYFEKNMNNRSSILFAIVEKESERHIGNARIHSVDWVHRSAYRGIMIGDKSSWGKGYGLEVINLLSEYAFERLNLNKLKSSAIGNNVGVNKINERAGYKREGEGREEFFRDGKYYNFIYWGLLRSDYMKDKKK